MKHSKEYYRGLDVMRGISCILIILYHYTVRYNTKPFFGEEKAEWIIKVPFGCAAVTTFFVLSGFLSAKHLISPKDSPFNYIKSRIIRLYPSYIVSVIITVIILYLFFPSALCSFKEIFFNFTMIPALFGARYVDGAYWTLQVELIFYFFSTITILLSKDNKKKILVLLIWLLLSICGNFLYLIFENSVINKLNILIASKHVQEFLFGVALYMTIREGIKAAPLIIIVFSIINQLLFCDLYHNIFLIISGIWIFLSTKASYDIYFEKPFFCFFRWIGMISYQVYLIHQMIGYVIIFYMLKFGYTSTIYIFVPIVLVISLAYIIRKYVEIPIINHYK